MSLALEMDTVGLLLRWHRRTLPGGFVGATRLARGRRAVYGDDVAHLALVPAAYVALLRGREVLLQQRLATGYMDGHWSFSAAGHVERGESVEMAAVREAQEELGIVLRLADLEPICTVHRRQTDRDRGQRVDFFFATRAWTGEPKVNEPDRSGGLRWSSLDDLPAPLVPVDAIALEMLRTGHHRAIATIGF